MKASVTLMSLVAALTPSSAVVAQPYETPPPVGAPRPAVIPAPFVQTLGNGLRVIVVQRKGLPLVTRGQVNPQVITPKQMSTTLAPTSPSSSEITA